MKLVLSFRQPLVDGIEWLFIFYLINDSVVGTHFTVQLQHSLTHPMSYFTSAAPRQSGIRAVMTVLITMISKSLQLLYLLYKKRLTTLTKGATKNPSS